NGLRNRFRGGQRYLFLSFPKKKKTNRRGRRRKKRSKGKPRSRQPKRPVPPARSPHHAKKLLPGRRHPPSATKPFVRALISSPNIVNACHYPATQILIGWKRAANS